ncbi:hypothetical protein EJ02DRAFT_491167 [Clathrospora elynae]|uniref:Uncharacterized protein n=1 Tax=Clathrospora elynae TaxID=706981 RepID=A0A6A5SQ00_9PLEO|nr:hypothetical protein EJ02DRAFT_491167 [Clathrospora elynae]
MVRKDGHHERTKHIENYYKYTRKEHHDGNILLGHLVGIKMPSDGLIKALEKILSCQQSSCAKPWPLVWIEAWIVSLVFLEARLAVGLVACSSLQSKNCSLYVQ